MTSFNLYGNQTTYIGSPLATTLPPATNLSIYQATPTTISGGGYVQLTPSSSSLIDFEFEGSFTYKKQRKGRKAKSRPATLSGGIVNNASIWDTDYTAGTEIIGLSVEVSEFQKASASNETLRNFERNLLRGDDQITGAATSGAGAWLYTYEGNDSVVLYTGFNYVELGSGNDRLTTYGDARTTVLGGPGADVYSPSLSGFTWVKDFEQGIDSVSLGFTPRSTYGLGTDGKMGLSLFLADGTAFARLEGAMSI